MIIQAYKCPTTGKIFEDPKEYRHFRRTHLAHQRTLDKLGIKIDQIDADINTLRESATSLIEINDFLMKKGKLLVEKTIATYRYTKYYDYYEDFTFTSFSWDIKWNDNVRGEFSIHPANAPLMPQGYPGWKGRFSFRYSGNYNGFKSDLLKGIRIYTGIGGGGNYSGTYDVKLFADDWPGMAIWHKLTMNESTDSKEI